MSNLSTKLPWDQAQTRWASQLNPLLANPVNTLLFMDAVLVTGVNVLNHRLGKNQQGWIITDIQGIATIYRSAPFNDKTLTLTSSADVTLTLGVF